MRYNAIQSDAIRCNLLPASSSLGPYCVNGLCYYCTTVLWMLCTVSSGEMCVCLALQSLSYPLLKRACPFSILSIQYHHLFILASLQPFLLFMSHISLVFSSLSLSSSKILSTFCNPTSLDCVSAAHIFQNRFVYLNQVGRNECACITIRFLILYFFQLGLFSIITSTDSNMLRLADGGDGNLCCSYCSVVMCSPVTMVAMPLRAS